ALQDAARARGVELSIQRLARPEDIVPAINAAKASDAAALNVLASALFYNNRTIIFDRVATLRLPAIYQWPEWAEEGGLIGYGPRTVQLFRDVVSRQLAALLRGTKPADLPVEQPTKFELVINLQAAKASRRRVRASAERWCDCDGRPGGKSPSRTDQRAHGPPPAAHGLSVPLLRRKWRPRRLWTRYHKSVPARGRLCR